MKKILLIGDSIRKGYDTYVKFALRNSCEVYFPEENCRFAQYVLRHISDWKRELGLNDDVDVVHWNAGLWDTLVLYQDGCLTPPDFYEYFIDKTCERIKKLFPNAKIVFATSTPVIEEKYPKPDESMRYNADVERYNEIAIKTVKKHGVEINDLHSVVKGLSKDYYSDMTHLYTPEGTQAITNAVLKAIGNSLGSEFDEFTLNDYKQVTDFIGH